MSFLLRCMSWPGWGLALLAALALATPACGPRGGDPALRPADPPASVRGVLRISAFGSEPNRTGAPARYRSVWSNGEAWSGMEDNDLRGFLDGRFRYGWNQPTQIHVRAGRYPHSARWGEYELFRALYRWEGVLLPPDASVRQAAIRLQVEEGARDLERGTLFLYEVKKDWNPGRGGKRHDNASPPAEGEVWWDERAHDREPWGLPGAGFASETDPDADTAAMPLAEAHWERGQDEIVFASPRLAAYVERQARAGQPLLFLLKLSDRDEDARGSMLTIYSGNLDDPGMTERRPRLEVEWESRAEVTVREQELHVEHGHSVVLPEIAAPGARILAVGFTPDDGHEAPRIEIRNNGDGWRPVIPPTAIDGSALAVRLVAARNPVVRGEAFHGSFRDTWVTTAPPEEQRVTWTFVAPGGQVQRVPATYAGDFTWEVRFEPGELGRWRCFFEHELDRPYHSPVEVFDVVPGGPEAVERQLRDLAARIRARYRDGDDRKQSVRRFGTEFWQLERAALANQTPASFRSPRWRATFERISEVRRSMSPDPVPDTPKLRAGKGHQRSGAAVQP